MNRLSAILLIFVGLLSTNAFGQVFVHINSGNPKFPFPQFLAYNNGQTVLGNLGTQNAEGVSHAEMEKSIREAYQIMANRFEYTGTVAGGVEYIKGNYGCPYDCTEGIGYAMLAAAYMADKLTFDGLWMNYHDVGRAKQEKYSDCDVILEENYAYGDNTLLDGGFDAASDGSVDIAMALLIAYRQWGENSGIIVCGKEINYLDEAEDVINGLVEIKNRELNPMNPDCRSVSGIIGLDGYPKNGNTWKETTDWASANSDTCPEFAGPQNLHVDYNAPAYYNEFGQFITQHGSPAVNIKQFNRAEASSDWLMGQLYDQGGIPFAGWVNVNSDGSSVQFSKFNEAEDFRHGWRHLLNYLWHGNPSTSWNPVTHQVESGSNQYEYQMALRFAEFLKNPQASPWDNNCRSDYSGVPSLEIDYDPITGEARSSVFKNNWIHASASAPVIAQDYELMADMYREAEIEWDVQQQGDNYLTSRPRYFHGWFRLLGMLTYSGNYHAPSFMEVPEANLRAYYQLDKTSINPDEEFTLTIDYRNYSSVAATNGEISLRIPEGFDVINSNGGSVTMPTQNLPFTSVKWDVGTVDGFTTGNLTNTTGSIEIVLKPNIFIQADNYPFLVRAKSDGKDYITADNSPNTVSPTLTTNTIDVDKNDVITYFRTDKDVVIPGTEVEYTLEFKNGSASTDHVGGRDGVTFSVGQTTPNTATLALDVKLWHDAEEPYINYGNYRVSYFMKDDKFNCISGEPGCVNGLSIDATIAEGFDKNQMIYSLEKLPEGEDQYGTWNQRLIIQFPDTLATTTPHIAMYEGLDSRVHRGSNAPFEAQFRIMSENFETIDFSDDWSFGAVAGSEKLVPVSPNWTSGTNHPVTTWHEKMCSTPSSYFERMLIEEWDGSTWRVVHGLTPTSLNSVENVNITVEIPENLTWAGFTKQNTLGESASYDSQNNTISLNIPKLYYDEIGEISYKAIVNHPTGDCPQDDYGVVDHKVYVSSDQSTYIRVDSVTNLVTCDEFLLCPAESDLILSSDKDTYSNGETITYSIDYTQLNGTKVETTTDAEWKSLTNTPMNIANGVISYTNRNTNLIHNYSFGTNGYTEFDLHIGQIYVGMNALMRTSATDHLRIEFKQEFADMKIQLYEKTNGTETSLGNVYSVATVQDDYHIRIETKDDSVFIWLNFNTENEPDVIYKGITQRAGYAGFASDAFTDLANGTASNYSAMFDVGFDLTISANIPENVTFTSASANGVADNDKVTWNLSTSDEPIPYGESFNLTWTGEVTAPSGEIRTIAKANQMGIESITACDEAMNTSIVHLAESASSYIAPNPANDYVQLTGVNAGLVTIKASNGSLVYTKEISQSTIDVSTYPTGLYFVTIEKEDEVIHTSFIKE